MRNNKIWETLIDAIKAAWVRNTNMITTHQQHTKNFLLKFDKIWVLNSVVVNRDGVNIIWKGGLRLLGEFL